MKKINGYKLIKDLKFQMEGMFQRETKDQVKE